MSETAVTPTTETMPAPPPPPAPAAPDGFFLDGDAPRLGSGPIEPPTPIAPPAPVAGTAAPTLDDPPPAPPAPAGEPVASMPPPGAVADLPSLPSAPPVKPATVGDYPDTENEPVDGAEPAHPMAHLMPAKSKPNEASMRAAEQRALRKSKSKKIKIGVAIGALIVAALVGPPFVSWLTNAINEAGGTTQEPTD